MIANNETVCQLVEVGGSTLRLQGSTATTVRGEATMPALSVVGVVRQSYTVRFDCRVGDLPFVSESLGLSISRCSAGEEPDNGTRTRCVACGAGTFSVAGDACAPCPLGTYSPNERSSECQPCPIGTFNAVTGSNTDRACTPCFEHLGLNSSITLHDGATAPTDCVCTSGCVRVLPPVYSAMDVLCCGVLCSAMLCSLLYRDATCCCIALTVLYYGVTCCVPWGRALGGGCCVLGCLCQV
jgi:hypothetical protein